jgi:hypothetical protein
MNKLLVPFLAILLMSSCGIENMTDMQPDQEIGENSSPDILSQEIEENDILARRGPAPMINVCKYDSENDSWKVINVNANAWPALEAQGAVQLIDEDGDGWVTLPNQCGIPVDCDDTDADLKYNCCTGIEITFNGPLYVAESDEPGTYNWQGAIEQCAAKALEDGCGWFLPNRDELNAMYQNKDEIGGFDSGDYWSSTENEDNGALLRSGGALMQLVSIGSQNLYLNIGRCRCVRR